jgi:hypothetical protein
MTIRLWKITRSSAATCQRNRDSSVREEKPMPFGPNRSSVHTQSTIFLILNAHCSLATKRRNLPGDAKEI